LKENKNVSIIEIAKLSGRGGTIIYKVLNEKLNYVPYNLLVKNDKINSLLNLLSKLQG